MKVRVASYNVHGFVGADGVRDVRRAAAVVTSLQADVIALQEVGFAESEDEPGELLAALTGYTAVAAPIQRRDGFRHGNVVLTRLPVMRSTRICLDFEAHEPRTAIEVWLQTPGTPLRVIATHLGLRPVERRHQVRTILSHVADDENAVTVLLGDFNEWFLIGRPLRWLHRRFGRSEGVATFPASRPLFALDRIWVHPPSSLRAFRAITSAEIRVTSDHLPVVAELEVG